MTRTFLTILSGLLICFSAHAAPSVKSVMVDGAGKIVAPTNFWTAITNDPSFVEALSGVAIPGEATNIVWPIPGANATASTNGLGVTINPKVGYAELNAASNSLRSTITSTFLGGATSFNTRTGPITLLSSDVVSALGFAPTNSGITNGFATTASVNSSAGVMIQRITDATNELNKVVVARNNGVATNLSIYGAAGFYGSVTFEDTDPYNVDGYRFVHTEDLRAATNGLSGGAGDVMVGSANEYNVACWGDSLTVNMAPILLSKLRPKWGVFNGGVSGQMSGEIAQRMTNDTMRINSPAVIWAGANNVMQPSQIVSDVGAMVAALPSPKKFLVLSVVNPTNGPIGSPQHQAATNANAQLSQIYSNRFLDVRSWAITNYNPAIPQDVLDFNNDVAPASLRTDLIHYNAAGSALIAGWVAAAVSNIESVVQSPISGASVGSVWENGWGTNAGTINLRNGERLLYDGVQLIGPGANNAVLIGNTNNPTGGYFVGIGQNAPTSKLEIRSSDDIQLTLSSPSAVAGVKFSDLSGFSYLWFYGAGDAWTLGDFLATTNRLNVSGGTVIGYDYYRTVRAPDQGLIVQGWVGIGKTNPAAALDVEGEVKGTSLRSTGNAVVNGYVQSPRLYQDAGPALAYWNGSAIVNALKVNTDGTVSANISAATNGAGSSPVFHDQGLTNKLFYGASAFYGSVTFEDQDPYNVDGYRFVHAEDLRAATNGLSGGNPNAITNNHSAAVALAGNLSVGGNFTSSNANFTIVNATNIVGKFDNLTNSSGHHIASTNYVATYVAGTGAITNNHSQPVTLNSNLTVVGTVVSGSNNVSAIHVGAGGAVFDGTPETGEGYRLVNTEDLFDATNMVYHAFGPTNVNRVALETPNAADTSIQLFVTNAGYNIVGYLGASNNMQSALRMCISNQLATGWAIGLPTGTRGTNSIAVAPGKWTYASIHLIPGQMTNAVVYNE
jgi:lysophospholipase L1-like esterase